MKISKLLVIGVTFCLTACLNAQNNLKIEFNHPKGELSKYLLKQKIERELTEKFLELKPYVQSATIILTLDRHGNIMSSDFVEKSEHEIFNSLVKRLALTTDGHWLVSGFPDTVESVKVAIPFIQKTPPMNLSLFDQSVYTKFQEFHQSLKPGNIEGCAVNSCVIMPEVKNVIGPTIVD